MPAAPPIADTAASSGLLNRREAVVVCVTAALVLLMGIGLCAAAILVPAPPTVVPLIAVACAGMPILAAWRLPVAVESLRAGRRRLTEGSVAALRRELDRLPETDHPLDR